MPRHQFIDPADLSKGGTWVADHGPLLCKWSWNAQTRKLTITYGPHNRRINVGKLLPDSAQLANLLPRLALGAAHRMAAEFQRPTDTKN